jgi:hypothetical protein
METSSRTKNAPLHDGKPTNYREREILWRTSTELVSALRKATSAALSSATATSGNSVRKFCMWVVTGRAPNLHVNTEPCVRKELSADGDGALVDWHCTDRFRWKPQQQVSHKLCGLCVQATAQHCY